MIDYEQHVMSYCRQNRLTLVGMALLRKGTTLVPVCQPQHLPQVEELCVRASFVISPQKHTPYSTKTRFIPTVFSYMIARATPRATYRVCEITGAYPWVRGVNWR